MKPPARSLRSGVALLSLVSGCTPLLASPAERPWTEVTTSHFQVQSDLPADELPRLAHQLERSYAALGSFAFPGDEGPPGRCRVVALAHADSLRQIRQDPRPAYFVRDDTLLAPSKLLVFSLEDDRRTREVFQHELTHRFMAHYFPAAPRWLNEGMATFLEATELDGDEVVVGAAPFPYEFDGFQWKSFKSPFADIVPSITELRATRGQLQSREYAGSWALVHLLMLGRPEHRAAFARYLDALRTAEVSEEEAFNASFDAPLRAELDGAYHAFPTLRTALPTQSVRLTKRTDDDFAARPLTLAERYALWGGLRSTNSLQAPLALGDAESAIRADPTAPHGYALRGRLRLAANDLPGAIADYRAASARERQDHQHLRALAFLQLKQAGLRRRSARSSRGWSRSRMLRWISSSSPCTSERYGHRSARSGWRSARRTRIPAAFSATRPPRFWRRSSAISGERFRYNASP